jgi:hypothetical protein
MRLKLRAFAFLVISLLLSGRVLAHHSFAAVFDGRQTTDIEGVVTEFNFVNPHTTMALEVASADGSLRTRIVEFDGELNLINAGWTRETIQVGERVRVHGNPQRDGGDRVWFLSLTREDGSELMRPMLERQKALEEQRRQRVRERSQSQ